MKLDPKLREFCTVRQLEIFEALEKHGTQRAAANALGCNKSLVNSAMMAVKKKAALQGYSPEHDMTRTVPDGFKVKGVSTYYNAEGKPSGQWVKSSADAERREQMIREAVAALSSEIRGMGPISKEPAHCEADLLAVYPSGDPHWGMLSWAPETGENFDLEICRELTLGAIDRLIASAPAAETAVFLPLGDVTHMNDQTNRTPGHQHQLDADGRFLKVLRVSIEAYRHAILRCLEKHKRVVVRFLAGNHDPQAVWALAFSIAAYFDNEPRVEVDLSPSKHWFFRFGKVLLGATHGDTVKPESLLGVMATDRAEDWGQTKFRYWYTGHVHHQSVREYPGVVCESFRTLAAKDAYAAAYGYRAGRDMRCIVHHKDFGEIERHRCDVAMLSA